MQKSMFRFGRATTQKRTEIKEKVERAKEIKKKIDEFREETRDYQYYVDSMLKNINSIYDFIGDFNTLISSFEWTYRMKKVNAKIENESNGTSTFTPVSLSLRPKISFKYLKEGQTESKTISSEDVNFITITIGNSGITNYAINYKGDMITDITTVSDVTYQSPQYHAYEDIDTYQKYVEKWLVSDSDEDYTDLANFCKTLKEKFSDLLVEDGSLHINDLWFDGIFTLMNYIGVVKLKENYQESLVHNCNSQIATIFTETNLNENINKNVASYAGAFFNNLSTMVFPLTPDGSTGSFELPEIMMVYEKKPVNAMFSVVSNTDPNTNSESFIPFDKNVYPSIQSILDDLIEVFKSEKSVKGWAENYVVNVFPTLSENVTTAEENDLSEYSQMQNMIAEERSKMRQKGKKGYVISFIQDDEGTIFNQWNAEEVNSASSETVQMAWYNGAKYIKMPTGYSGEPVDFRDDNYYKNCIYLENNDNLSYTRNVDLNGIMSPMTLSVNQKIQKMCGYFVITTSN